MSEYKQLVTDIIKNVGGKENVTSLRHCVTRLRFKLVDESKANDEILKNMDGVITIMKAMGEYMVVIGEHVPAVYKEACRQLGFEDGAVVEQQTEKKENMFKTILGFVTGALGPCLAILCSAGIIKGITTLATLFGLSTTSGAYMLLNAAGDAFFYFMPLFLGYNAGKKFGIDPFVGMLIAAAMSYPTIQNTPIELLGFTVAAKYQGTFFPILISIGIAAPIYKALDKVIPKIVKTFLLPTLTLLIMFPIAFMLIGPVVNTVAGLIPAFINAIMNISPVLTCAVLGGLWQVFVLFGIHGPVSVVEFTNLMQGSPSLMMGVTGLACFAQIGVVAAILLKTKDTRLKSISLSSFISGVFGVTEPAIYGVTLPRIKMFIISCIGAAVTGGLVGLMNTKIYYFAGMGIIGLLGYINPADPQILPVIIATVVGFVTSFVIAFVMYKDDEVETTNVVSKKKLTNKEVINAPLSGAVKPLSECKDDAFAMGHLGKGVLILPNDGKVVAPFDGTVRALFPTKHAIGVVSENGCEVLIHIGMNTVSLEGKHYEAYVKQGDKVKKGQLLVSFDKEAIEKEGFSVETPIIITNSNDYLDVVVMTDKELNINEELITVIM